MELFTNEVNPANKRRKEADDGKVSIKLLGQFEMEYGGKQIDNILKKARKTRRLVALLVLNDGNPVGVHQLYEQLWEEEDIDNPEGALKTLVSRTRSMFSQIAPALRDLIIAHTGAYSWNMAMTREVDMFRVETLVGELLGFKEDNNTFRQHLGEMMMLYTGKLLPEMSVDEFVMVNEIRIEDKYKRAVNHAIALFVASKSDDIIIRTCRVALMVLPYEDAFHIALIRALIRLNRRSEAMAQYRYISEATMRYFGTHPSVPLQETLHEIICADEQLEKDVNLIAKELTEETEVNGAYVCEYAIFKDIYRLQVRSLNRTNISCYLIILKVNIPKQERMNPMELDNVMRRLMVILQQNLRVGDIITRYTAMQYAILLKGASLQHLKAIISRVRMSFYAEPIYERVELEYMSRSLEENNN
jgi:DNA-binding transcriptional activator of the SARP family